MSLVNNEELKNLTNTTNGSINKQVVDFAKNILFSQLKSYISDEKQYKIINDKIYIDRGNNLYENLQEF